MKQQKGIHLESIGAWGWQIDLAEQDDAEYSK